VRSAALVGGHWRRGLRPVMKKGRRHSPPTGRFFNDSNTIVSTDAHDCVRECVHYPHGVRGVHEVLDVPDGNPRDGECLGGGRRRLGEGGAPEDEVDDAAAHVLVHPGQGVNAHGDPGLFFDLAA